MRISLQYKLLAAFMALVVLGPAGIGAGGSMLIRDYFVARKQHELTDKAYEMARMVNAYYDGRITHGQLHNFVNSVDSFLDARVWAVDKDLNLITVSEERPDDGQVTRRPASVVKPSPMPQERWDCDVPGESGGMMSPGWQHNRQAGRPGQLNPNSPSGGQSGVSPRSVDSDSEQPSGGHHGMMGGWRSDRQNIMGRPEVQNSQQVQQSRSAAPGVAQATAEGPALKIMADKGQPSITLDLGQGAQKGEQPNPAIGLADIKGMSEIIQAVRANYGQTWAKTYYHPYYEENMLIVAVPLIRQNGTVNGTVMINAPIEEIDNFLQHIYKYLSYAGVVAILFAVVLAAYMARGIARPLRAMRETAAALAGGNYDQRITVTTSDEVGDLGQSLNSLAHDLGEYVRRMELADKMRRDFVANVSHELRTPLTIMRGYNQALQDGTVTDCGQVRKYHRVMGDEILRLEKLIAELLDLSQLQANGAGLEIEQVSLAEVVDNVSTLLKQKSEEKGVTVVIQIDPSVPSVQGDGDRLTQLVLILMDNALKFTQPGGQIAARLIAGDDGVSLSVADTGAGIPVEDLPHIWERFYKADKSRSSGGTGLGLAIARQIIELHGATVEVTSACGDGTTFTIRFPIIKNGKREVK
ncbi:sensor histidine kinase [Anaeroselena agilis]|uniref:histidine kinase n=1 Tax=Anaeroselena agilis TaxID=3063788 RepID=A0ABU3NX80_9FIRM|nr:ATP-binding protein [Selenomonadales bacterium 4137-cl]